MWATGVEPVPLVRSLGAGKDKAGRALVDGSLRLLDANGSVVPNVYALGDAASIKGGPLAATAQVASQQGAYLARGAHFPA